MSQAIIAEIKAACSDPERIEALLNSKKAKFVGEDHQIDTYFIINEGRLKLRQGQVENTLIYYNRPESKGIKNSNVKYLKLDSSQTKPMKDILDTLFVALTIVDKIRKIYFIENIKFHIDQVKGLGSFVEIEAIGENNESLEYLTSQCKTYQKMFQIKDEDCIDSSYSDLILNIN